MVKINPVKNVGTGAGEVFKQETASNENELKTINAGIGISVSNDTSEVTISADPAAIQGSNIPVLNDVFTDAAIKPFWTNTQMFTSGDWQYDAANDRLEGIAENNEWDWYRQGIEGDADHAFKYDCNSTSVGIEFSDGTTDIEFIYNNNTSPKKFQFKCTGETTIELEVDVTAADFWMRLVRIADDFYAYYKVADADPWILVGTHADQNLGHDMTAYQNSADLAAASYIYAAILYDNSFNGSPTKAKFVKEIPLTDAATIAVDASLGNLFTVTLGGNRTLGAPTNGKQGQMIVFRITQDGTGSRTLAYNAIYRFSTDIPSPTLSTGAGDVDYLGFIYNEAETKWDCIGKVFGF